MRRRPDTAGDFDRHVTAWHADLTTYLRSYWPHKAEVFDLVVHCAYARRAARAAIDGEPMAPGDQPAARRGHVRLGRGDRAAAGAVLQPRARVPGRSSAERPSVEARRGRHPPGRRRAAGRPATAGRSSPASAWRATATESGLPVHVVRPFSGYAEEQSLDYPFPSIRRPGPGPRTRQCLGRRDQVRDWIHVDDVVAGALAVVDAGRTASRSTSAPASAPSMAELVARWSPSGGLDAPDDPNYQPDKPGRRRLPHWATRRG
jgi:hypothetical protein